ncbi:Holliday junction resolvase RuvX [Woodsholea maritima]|uniref:Holliday junction resolvase RuvX n=1 Tax=Woodsholea maritima TaxID=240237 RepID=UPI000362F6E2|nr:Holliday junction resolvase RuvX [Woodsholea maritima]
MPRLTSLHDLPPGPLMGVDVGSKTLGLAVCNRDRTLVSALETIWREKFTPDAQKLLSLYDERACQGLVIGLPISMDGGDSRSAQSARSFATNMLRLRDLPIVFQDERLSTFAATERLIEAGVKPSHRKARLDGEAAAIILQGALDALHQGLEPPDPA